MAGAPYRRVHKHGKGRGTESTVACSYCGKKVPKYKTFIRKRGFTISDPGLRKELTDTGFLTAQNRLYVCPSCARHRRISQPGKARGTRRQN
jgi:ribosomal protein S26